MSRIPLVNLLLTTLTIFVFSYMYAATSYAGTKLYKYDELNRLQEVTLENNQKIIYKYDEIGNLLSKTVTTNPDAPITTATPTSGTYYSILTVTLSANEASTIYYTTDGSTPTTSSSVYSTPLSISKSTTLKYFARDAAGNCEAVKYQTYVISSGNGPSYIETFDSTSTIPAGWNAQESSISTDGYRSSAHSLMLGDGWSTDGNASFVAPMTGSLYFWYYKDSEWGYYRHEDEWNVVGNNVGTMTVSINGSVVYTASTDEGWVSTPLLNVHAGDTIRIAQAGNHDDGGVYCNNFYHGTCPPMTDPYYNVSVYIDDVGITGGETVGDTIAPITTAAPVGGTYSSVQTVTLSANEPATIHYTTDGTTPTTSSAVYSTPLTISASTTLKYFARDQYGNNEAVKAQTYTIVHDFSEAFDASTLPSGWSIQGEASISGDTYHSAAYSLLLGDGWSTDGSVSFVAPATGNLSFWYTKSGAWGYYHHEDDWDEVGTGVGSMTVAVNGSVVYTASADTGWVSAPLISVHAGDTIRIAQVGNHDDGGAYCNNFYHGTCPPMTDPYYNVSVYIDDVRITGGL